MWRIISKNSVKAIAGFVDLSLILQYFVAPIAFLLAFTPASAAITPEIDLSYSAENSEFTLTAEPVISAQYTLQYTNSDEVTQGFTDSGEADENKVFTSTGIAGTQSGESYTYEEVVSGNLDFTAVLEGGEEYSFSSDFSIEDGTLVLESEALSQSEVAWVKNEDGSYTWSQVALNQTLIAPQNENVRLTFTTLPENPGSITVEEVTLSDEQVHELGALTSTAYNITSSMEDGSFTYDLTLPNPVPEKEVSVQYSEDGETFENTDEENQTQDNSTVTIRGLDHFTVFVVTSTGFEQETATSFTVDNGNAEYSEISGTWKTSGSSCSANAIDNDGRYAQVSSPDAEATYTFTVPVAGTYTMHAHWITHTSQTTSAVYTVTDNSSATLLTDTVDQSGSNCTASGWHVLSDETTSQSTVNLDPAETYTVSLTQSTATGSLYADAIKVTLLESVDEAWVDDDWIGSAPGDIVGSDHVFGHNAFATIQEAVDAVNPAGSVYVAAGTYTEQVLISKDIDLIGSDSPVIEAPTTVSQFTFTESSKYWEPVIFAYGGTDTAGSIEGTETITANISGFIVDGNDRTPTSGRRASGILYRNSGGTIESNQIHSMLISNHETFGIMVYGDSNVSILENSITEYARGGIGVNGDNGPQPDPTAVVDANIVTGPGPDEIVTWAPNGIQLGYGTTGTITNNTVTGNGWPGSEWSGTALMAVDTNNVVISGNTVQNNEQAIGVVDFPELLYGSAWTGIVSNIEVTNNIITDNQWGLTIANEVDGVMVTGNTFANIDYDAIDVYTYHADVTAPTNITITNNALDTTIGEDGLWVSSTVTQEVNAIHNWWGSATGPSGDGSGAGASVIGNAEYCPWLDAVDGSPVGGCLGEIQGRKYLDVNGNGYQDNAEKPGLKDWEIRLYSADWTTLVDSMLTGDDSAVSGSVDNDQFNFENLAAGTYHVCEVNQPGYTQIAPYLASHPQQTNGSIAHTDAIAVTNESPNTSEEGNICWTVEVPANGDSIGYIKFGNTDADLTPPAAPTLIAPNDDHALQSSGLPLQQKWSAVADAVNYQYQSCSAEIGDLGTEVCDPSDVIYTTELSNTQRTVGNQGNINFWWRVRAQDAAGNWSLWSESREVTVDNDAPTLTLTSNFSGSLTADTTPTFDGTATDAFNAGIETVLYKLESTAGTEIDWTSVPTIDGTTGDSARNYELTLSALSDGEYTLFVQAFDRASNESTVESKTFTVDTTAPLATLNAPVEDEAIAGVFTIRGTIEEDIQLQNYNIAVYADGANFMDFSQRIEDLTVYTTTGFNDQGIYVWNTDNGNFPDGYYLIRLAARDAAQNRDLSGDPYAGGDDSQHVIRVLVDNTLPTSTITGPGESTDSATLVVNDWDGTVEGTAADTGSGVHHVELTIQNNEGEYWNDSLNDWDAAEYRLTATGTTSWTYDLGFDPAEDTYTVTSHAVDNAGNMENSATLIIVLDKTIPEVTLTIDPTDPDGDNNWYITRPTITLLPNDMGGATIDYVEYQWNHTSGTWTQYVTPFQPTGEGSHILNYRAVDTAGNISDIGVKNVKWDETEIDDEEAFDVDASPNPTSGSTTTVTWDEVDDNTGISEYKITWKLQDTDTEYSKTVNGNTLSTEIDQLEEGQWDITVTAYDGVGNTRKASTTLTVDRTAPAAPTLTLDGTGEGSVSLSWNAVEDANDYIIYYGTTTGEYIYAARVGNITEYTVQGLGGGNYFFVVRAVDTVDNQSANSNEVNSGDILGAAGATGGPATGFEPAGDVLGVTTDEGATNDESGEISSGVSDNNNLIGSVLGASTADCTVAGWWWTILAIYLVALILIHALFSGRLRTFAHLAAAGATAAALYSVLCMPWFWIAIVLILAILSEALPWLFSSKNEDPFSKSFAKSESRTKSKSSRSK